MNPPEAALALRMMGHDDYSNIVPPNAIHKDSGVGNAQKPYHTPSCIVKNQILLSRHDYTI